MRGLYNRRSPSETALTMNVEEFHDFVIDCQLETDNGQPCTRASCRQQGSDVNAAAPLV